jgi:hypothetical protein
MSRKAVLERTLGKKAAKRFLAKQPKEESVTLELPTDLLDQIVVAELIRTYEALTTDLAARKKDNGMAIFELDKELDIKTMEGHLFCFETVLKYYGASLK